MPSFFPDILFLGPLVAPLALRAGLVVALGFLAWRLRSRARGIALLLGTLALLFTVGAFVQIAALAVIVLAALSALLGKKAGVATDLSMVALVLGASFALVILGAGAFAIDLPF